jgi:hypothetical protein
MGVWADLMIRRERREIGRNLEVEGAPHPAVLRKNIILKELEGRLGKECDSMGVRQIPRI